jgi:DNA-binding transcriptional LysR family regulator
MERFTNIAGLLAFVTVAKEGSASAASGILNLTQPAISHQLKRLSDDIGVTLFKRAPHGLELTEEGKKLLVKAEQVIDSMSEFQRSASHQSERIRGTVRIGTIVDPAFIRLGLLLGKLRRDYPDIETQIHHGMSGETLQRLNRRQIDSGFYLTSPHDLDKVGQELDDHAHVRKLADFSYRVIGPAGWDRQISQCDWPTLAKLPWIGTPELSVHNRLLRPIFESHGVKQNAVAQVDQESSMLEMVRSGIGLSLSRESIALEQKQSTGLAVCESVSVPACLCFVTRERGGHDPVQRAVSETIKAVWD